MKTIGVLTSGGDSPGMNTALRSIVRTCAHYKIKCVGIVRGYSGLIEDNTRPEYPLTIPTHLIL